MSKTQVNGKTLAFIKDHRMSPFIFLVDPDDKVIDEYGIRNTHIEEPIEKDVPYPTTYLLDSNGVVRLKDSRHDFHIWLSASALSKALGKIDQQAAK
jgi:peroxiredoxin